jgi:hypothetical protein
MVSAEKPDKHQDWSFQDKLTGEKFTPDDDWIDVVIAG